MNEKRKTRPWGLWVAVIGLLFLVAYPLSIAPLVKWWLGYGWKVIDGDWLSAYCTPYYSLRDASPNVVREWASEYENWWGL